MCSTITDIHNENSKGNKQKKTWKLIFQLFLYQQMLYYPHGSRWIEQMLGNYWQKPPSHEQNESSVMFAARISDVKWRAIESSRWFLDDSSDRHWFLNTSMKSWLRKKAKQFQKNDFMHNIHIQWRKKKWLTEANGFLLFYDVEQLVDPPVTRVKTWDPFWRGRFTIKDEHWNEILYDVQFVL